MKTVTTNVTLTKVLRKVGLLSTLLVMIFSLQSCKKDTVTDPLSTENYKSLNTGMRKLWAEHMQWTYATVDAFFHNSTGVSAQMTRLLKNQEDIGNAVIPYYGTAGGNQLTALLKDHINKAVPVLTAAQSGNTTALNTALDDWYANAQDIADFLADANPNWDRMEMRHMMKMHIDQTVAYSVDLLNNNYTSAIVKYQDAFDHMMEMADDLAKGIAKQFPDKF
ncbi:MAG: hypothetical protein LC122_03820 [Chitinophagales bacterium]|nr:hypothetical protein [Chitinophagales bacterium]